MQGFEQKRKNLFECLDAIAEKNIKGTLLDQSSLDEPLKKHFKKSKHENPNISKLRGSESFFKKPELPITKCLKPRIAPDYSVNPQKWTKYSLDDADISDRMNSTAAFQFLKDLENKKFENDNSEDRHLDTIPEVPGKGKLIFNKSVGVKRSLKSNTCDESIDDNKPKLKGSKVVMPEYVVGKSVDNKERKNRPRKIETPSEKPIKSLKLAHLLSFDEDENEDEDKE